jgi:hypothetical protein
VEAPVANRKGPPSDTHLIDHLQWLIERRSAAGNTGSVTIEYEEHGPLIEMWAGEVGSGQDSRAKGADVRAMLTASMQKRSPLRRRRDA